MEFIKKFIGRLVIGSESLLMPFYLGLVIAQLLYCIKFIVMIFELLLHFWTMTENELVLSVLTLVDVYMIAILLKLIITSGKKESDKGEEKVSSGMLKVKLAGALVTVSSIHLAQSLVNYEHTEWREIFMKGTIHLIFLISTIGLVIVDYVGHLNKEEKH